MKTIGDSIESFELRDDSGASVRFEDLLERGPAIFSFYPADFTPVCTAQACMLRDEHAKLEEAGVMVVSISPQPTESKARFRERHGLTQVMLADPDRIAIRAFGVGFPLGIVRRATFLVDESGVVRDRVVADFRVKPHRSLLARAVGRGGDA